MENKIIFCRKCIQLFGIKEEDNIKSHWKKEHEQIPELLLKMYIFQEVLGKGSFGVVFNILDRGDNFKYALKLIEIDEENKNEVKREVEILASANHRNIIRYYSTHCLENDGYIAIKMELAYCNLSNVIDNSPQNLMKLVKELCEGINYLHNQSEKSIIHRDLKPTNILLKDNVIKIIDFGISIMKKNKNDQNSVYVTSKAIGTLNYLPPEILERLDSSKGFKSSDKVDIWSLGIIIHQLIFKDHPFLNPSSENDTSIMQSVLANKLNLNSEIELNPTIHQIVKGCLQKNPKQRFNIKEILSILNLRNENETKEKDRKINIIFEEEKNIGIFNSHKESSRIKIEKFEKCNEKKKNLVVFKDFNEKNKLLEDYKFYNEKGETLDSQGKYEEAIIAFDKAIQINPNDEAAYNNKADALLSQEKYDEAIISINKAIQINPNNELTYN